MNASLFLLLFMALVARGIEIKCNFETLDWTTIGSQYTCSIDLMDLCTESADINSIYGTHLTGKSNSNVAGITTVNGKCSEYKLQTVPKGLLEFFPNLIAIELDGCFINDLNGDELVEYTKLKSFSITRSQLHQIPGNLFASTPSMTSISFEYSEIEYVGEGLLDNLNSLTYENFQQNICINRMIESAKDIPELNQWFNLFCNKNYESTTLPTTSEPSCYVPCEGDREIGILMKENRILVEKMQSEVNNLSEKMNKIEDLSNFLAKRMKTLIHNF